MLVYQRVNPGLIFIHVPFYRFYGIPKEHQLKVLTGKVHPSLARPKIGKTMREGSELESLGQRWVVITFICCHKRTHVYVCIYMNIYIYTYILYIYEYIYMYIQYNIYIYNYIYIY